MWSLISEPNGAARAASSVPSSATETGSLPRYNSSSFTGSGAVRTVGCSATNRRVGLSRNNAACPGAGNRHQRHGSAHTVDQSLD